MYKQSLFKQKLLVHTLSFVIVLSFTIITGTNPLQQAYSINPTNPNDDVIKGSVSSLTNEPNSATQWITTRVYKMENVKTSPTFNSTFYMIKTDGTAEHKHYIISS
jgi:hypothetical protein